MAIITRRTPVSTIAAALAACVLFSTAACGGNAAAASGQIDKPQDGGTTTIEVGVCPGPYGDMVKEVIAPLLKDDGYELITKEFNDYVQPDKALAAGSIDANLMQHGNYLAKFSADNNLDLVSLGQVPTLGLGVYSNKYDSIDEIADGASIGIANDASNLARSLGVLEQQKLITLDGDVDATKASTDDIASNPKNLTVSRSMPHSSPVPLTLWTWCLCPATTHGRPGSRPRTPSPLNSKTTA